jgi:hypothetical protein
MTIIRVIEFIPCENIHDLINTTDQRGQFKAITIQNEAFTILWEVSSTKESIYNIP